MPHNPARGKGIAALAIVLIACVAADAARRILWHPSATRSTTAASSAGRTQAVSGTARALPRAASPGARTDAGLDSTSRAAALRMVADEGAGTYLPAMLASDDSALRRWPDDRAGRPLLVGVTRGAVPGFRESFVANVVWAITRWNGVGLPVSLEETGDTSGADIVITWAERLDSNRTGRADVTWQRGGAITHVHVVLATHTPDGVAVNGAQMVALALHELGHALGLDHSPLSSDALYPETAATDLTTRDRRTAALLYSLPPGSFK